MEALSSLLGGRNSVDVQQAAIAVIAKTGGKPAATALIAAWPEAGPALRGEIFETLIRRRDWTMDLPINTAWPLSGKP
jgi:hypothetical protein